MAYSRAEVPELENLLKYGKKKFVRYDEGAKLYSMGFILSRSWQGKRMQFIM